MDNPRPLVFGPAYLDLVLTLAQPLLAPEQAPVRVLDQSLPAARMLPRNDGLLEVRGPTGDRLRLPLPPAMAACAATYELCEPVLMRVCGPQTDRILDSHYPVEDISRQLGGMGAGYAKALDGLLRMPLGCKDGRPDAVGREVFDLLAHHAIASAPACIADCESDTSLLLQSRQGDKLAIGVRQAMTRWQVSPEDHTLAAQASALVFCGAPNPLAAAVLERAPAIPVMFAPALRNVSDQMLPLSQLSERIHYLSLNALEWENMADRERLRRNIPVITVTEGARGSRILLGEREILIPAEHFTGDADTNRAGETYGATFFRMLLQRCPDFPQTGVPVDVAEYAGHLAAQQAAKQLAIRGFAFPDF